MSDTPPDTPLRLRDIRIRKGMTQTALAEKARLSVRTIRDIEQADDPNPSLRNLHAIARALDITTGELFSAPTTADLPPTHDVHGLRALLEPAAPAGEALSARQLRDRFRLAALHKGDMDFERAISAFVALIPQARASVEAADQGADLTAAKSLLAQTYDQTAELLVLVGQPDLAIKATLEQEALAKQEGNPVWLAGAVATRSWAMTRKGEFGAVAELAERTATAVEPQVNKRDVERAAMWGLLMCWVSSAAARNNQPDLAADARRRASVAAAMLGRDEFVNGHGFGPIRAAVRGVEDAVVREDFGTAARLARDIPRQGRWPRLTRYRHALDMANIHLEHRKDDRALAVLRALKDDAPAWLACQRYAATITTKLVARSKRRLSPDLRDLADFLRLP